MKTPARVLERLPWKVQMSKAVSEAMKPRRGVRSDQRQSRVIELLLELGDGTGHASLTRPAPVDSVDVLQGIVGVKACGKLRMIWMVDVDERLDESKGLFTQVRLQPTTIASHAI
jgi:hypothetical protein